MLLTQLLPLSGAGTLLSIYLCLKRLMCYSLAFMVTPQQTPKENTLLSIRRCKNRLSPAVPLILVETDQIPQPCVTHQLEMMALK